MDGSVPDLRRQIAGLLVEDAEGADRDAEARAHRPAPHLADRRADMRMIDRHHRERIDAALSLDPENPWALSTSAAWRIEVARRGGGALYGADFRYNEMMVAGEGEKGEAMAKMIAGANPLAGPDAPKPGEGPTKEERETGYYDILFIGETARGEKIRASVRGDRDPGYGSTSKMIAEAAIALIDEAREVRGGVWTPAAAMAAPLLKRLEAHAGLKFARE